MTALKMGNPAELGSLDIKLLHFLSAAPASMTQICRKLQILKEHAERRVKKLVEKRFITKQTNGQYRNLIKNADIPPLPALKAEPPAAARPEPAARCTYPICTCPKDTCEEDPLVDTNAKAPNPAEPYERLAWDLKNVEYKSARVGFEEGIIDACLKEVLDPRTDFAKPYPLSQVGVTFNEQQATEIRKLIAVDRANALRDNAFADINPAAIKNVMEIRQDSPLADDLKQELYLITEQLAQPRPLLLADIDKKLHFISYIRLLLEKLPHTSTLLDEIHADYMELKRQQETA